MPVGKKTHSPAKKRSSVMSTSKTVTMLPYTPIDFRVVEQQANQLADRIESHFEELAHVLLEYESYEVVLDEVERTLDVLRNLKENKDFFRLRIGAVTSFLPRNQPLYALTCFVVVPALMASEVHFRIPHSMRHFFPKLLALLRLREELPHVTVSHSKRMEFLQERSALRIHPKTKETLPVTDAVIFTGTPAHADQLRVIFDERTLFITNGSGHNPIVVSEDADIQKAVEATLTLQLYNQGQDCAAPNSILVHKTVFHDFLRMLRDEIRAVRVGDYRDRRCRVGPISDPKDLVRIQDFLIDNREWLDPTTPGIIRAYDAILEPTIMNKPLNDGGNFSEIFAPVIFLQKYENDSDLKLYFEDPRYARNAMYVTVYGTSPYVKKLIGRKVDGKVLHDKASFLHNTHLHAQGMERGTQPYGGNGYGASSLSIHGEITTGATLPQRDIYERVAKPLQNQKLLEKKKELLSNATSLHNKDVQKLMRFKAENSNGSELSNRLGMQAYVDLKGLQVKTNRYASLEEENIYRLLDKPNLAYIARLRPNDIEAVRSLRKLLSIKNPEKDFATKLYALAVGKKASSSKKRELQLRFFQVIYQLLLGRDSGPRLTQFLLEIDRKQVRELLDI